MKTTFAKETLRTIRHSFGRFAAIVIIVAVGCGFFAGLRMSGSGMRQSADAYADQAHLFDIQLTSTLGISQSTVNIIDEVPGVGEVMCTKSVDTISQVGDYNHEIRITSLTPENIQKGKERPSGTSDLFDTQSSENVTALNQPTLVSGRWPEGPDECVLLHREAIPDDLGGTINVLYGSQSLDGTLESRQFKIVGYVNSPVYLDTATISTTSLGSGSLWGVAFVGEDAFSSESPYTELFISVPVACGEVFGTSSYYEKVQSVKNEITTRLDDIANARREEVQAKAQAELDKNTKTYNDKVASINEALDRGAKKINDAEQALRSSQDQIRQARSLLAKKKAQLQQAYEAGVLPENLYQAQMAAIEAQEQALLESQVKVDQGEARLTQERSSYEQQRARAYKELRDAKKQLEAAQKRIEDIEKPNVYLLDRDQNFGAVSFKNDSERIDSIATLFPFFFFVVAALVALTTMMRMVEDDRQLIGTFKALGYSGAKIASKYLVYAGVASLTGALLGIGLMSQLLPSVILQAYSIIYVVPARAFPLPLELSPAIVALVLGVGITLGATLLACVASLKETPATLMQPKAPKPGKRILLERIRPIWKHFSFSWKVTIRNIFRYKTRFFMTAIGVAGCTMLLVTGFGVRDAINDIIDNQFGSAGQESAPFSSNDGTSLEKTQSLSKNSGLTRYNAIISFANTTDLSQANSSIEAVQDYLLSQNGVKDIAALTMENLVVHTGADNNQKHTLQLECPEDNEQFSQLNQFRVRTTQDAIPFDDDAVILTEKLATTLNVAPGDQLALYDQDKIGNPAGSPHMVTISNICENYLGSYLYIGKAAYLKAFGTPPIPNTLICNINASLQERNAIADHLQTMENVDTVRYNDELISRYRDMLKSVDLVMIVLIIAAMILAFVVLYNLANINIAERIREIASLKVLGFRRREVAAYVFREILIIVGFGALAGLVLGWGFESYVVVTAEVDAAMFGRVIHASSYIFSLGLTMLFAAFVCVSMLPKLAHIDMVESLKSVD